MIPLFLFAVCAPLLLLPLFAWRLAARRGGAWRIAALLPLAALAFVILRIVVDTAADPTSHNLWPFELVIWGWSGLAWLAVVALAQRLLPGAAPDTPLALPSLAALRPALRVGAAAFAMFLFLEGWSGLRGSESRGGAAAIVLAVVVAWWSLTGRIPTWFRR